MTIAFIDTEILRGEGGFKSFPPPPISVTGTPKRPSLNRVKPLARGLDISETGKLIRNTIACKLHFLGRIRKCFTEFKRGILGGTSQSDHEDLLSILILFGKNHI